MHFDLRPALSGAPYEARGASVTQLLPLAFSLLPYIWIMSTLPFLPKTRYEDNLKPQDNFPSLTLPRHVRVFHPFFSEPEIYFLELPAFDTLHDSRALGVEHRLVLDACFVMTNNSPGFLSTSSNRNDQQERLLPNTPSILAPGRYYYHLDTSSSIPYQVVTDFNAWRFPDSVPSHWKLTSRRSAREQLIDLYPNHTPSTMSSSVIALDRGCIITQYGVCECL